MIFTERTIMVVNDSATINKPLILYRGDKNIELKITIAESQFKFRNTDASNVIETTDASYAQLVINTPYGSPIFSDVAATKNGAVIFVISAAMIDEIREVGIYDIQIRLLDDDKQSRVTIPPVSNAIEIREPMAIEDGSAVDSNVVNVAKVNRALTTTSAPLEAFDSQGNYIKKTWGDGDPITDAALNKMEAGIEGVNKKVASLGTSGEGMTQEQISQLSTAYQHSQSAHAPSNAEANIQADWNETNTTSDAYIKNKPTNLATIDDIPVIPTKTSQLTNDSGYITNIPDEYITETELNAKGYATTSQIPTVPTNVSAFTNDANYASETYVTNKISEAQLGGGSGTTIVNKKIDRYIYIAASNSSDKNKAVADYICTGTNDEVVIQQAVDELTHGGTIQLLDGDYYFDSFPVNNSCVYFKNSGYARTITIKGTTENKSYLSHYGVAIHVTKNAWDSITDDTQRYCVFDSTPYKMPIGDWSALINNANFENMYIFLYNSQKKVTGINGFNLSSMEIVQVGVYSEQYFHDRFYHVKPATPIDTIGVITPEASNDEMARIGLNCLNVGGLHTGLIIKHTDHVIAKTCTIARCCYGYVFNGPSAKTLTLINCCDEGNTHLPRFINNGQLTMIDFNIERFNADYIPDDADGNTYPYATEENGNWSGFISYTLQGNAFNTNGKFWAKNTGKKFKTINLCNFNPTDLSSNTNADVAPSIPCTNLTLNNTTLSFTTTDTQTLTATATPTNTTDKIIWSVEPTGIVSVNAGVVTPIKDGNCTITATCGTQSATCTATVTVTGVKEDTPCTNIALNTSTLTFTDATPQTLTATLTPSDTTDEVIWSVNPTGAVFINNGVITPAMNGSCVITATCGTQSATCNVTISGIDETVIIIPESGLTLTQSDFTNNKKLDTPNDGSIIRGSNNTNVCERYIVVSDYSAVQISTNVTQQDGAAIRVVFYDESKNVVDKIERVQATGTTGQDEILFTSGASYMRVQVNFITSDTTVTISGRIDPSDDINSTKLISYSDMMIDKRYTNSGVLMDEVANSNWRCSDVLNFEGGRLFFRKTTQTLPTQIKVCLYGNDKTFTRCAFVYFDGSSSLENGQASIKLTRFSSAFEYADILDDNISYISICIEKGDEQFEVYVR